MRGQHGVRVRALPRNRRGQSRPAPLGGVLRPALRCCPDPGLIRPHRPARLHRGGDRQANSALWRIALVRMGCHQPTKDYVARRTAEGKTKTEIMRCLKRYIAREVYPHLTGKATGRPTVSSGHHVPEPTSASAG
jgi:hypothetical protein